ncbi:FHA domain-containing protein [Myxococcota bacterium]
MKPKQEHDPLELGFVREALPHMLEPYEDLAQTIPIDEFVRQVPCPCLIYVRSTLWEPIFLLSGAQTGSVAYDFAGGGHSFLSPIKKRQTDPDDPGVLLGRGTDNDLVVPVTSISTKHCRFAPSFENDHIWTCTDLGAKNGTFLREKPMQPNRLYPLEHGDYLRLGGNLIAWFLLPHELWELLRSPLRLKELIDI